MPDTNPFDALDDPTAQPVAAPARSAQANPFDALDEPGAQEHTADRMQEVTDQAHMPEVTVSARRGPEASWSDVARGIPTAIGANIETKVAGAQEFLGRTAYDDARKKFWQATILPAAVRQAQKDNVALTDLPEVQGAARHLGIRPDTFTHGWPTYVNQSDEELNGFKSEQRDRIQAGAQQIASGTRKRLTAQQVQQYYAPNMDEHSLKSLVFDAASMAPHILAGVGGTLATGGIGGAAIMAADIAPNEYAEARNKGLDHNQASTYAVLTTVASSVPEIPVLKIVENAPLAKKIIGSVVGEKLAATGAGKVAGATVAQGVTQSVVNALQQGIDAGVLNEHLPLDEALKQVAWSGLVGGVLGAPVGAYHAATTRQPKPTTFREFPAAGESPEPGHGPAATTEPPMEQAPSVAPPSVARLPDEAAPVPETTAEQPQPPIDSSADQKGSGEEKNTSPPEEHEALEAVKQKTATPSQTEHLENLGLVRRNDLGEPMLLPAGRRRLTALDKGTLPPVTPPLKQAENGPVKAETAPETPVLPPEGPKEPSKSALMSETPVKPPRKAPEAVDKAPPDLRNRLSTDKILRDGLTAMKGETGWAEIGGKLLRDATTGEPTGRTSWIPNAEWWPDRPKGLTEQQVHQAVDKAIAGRPLSKRETSMVQFMVDVHDTRESLDPFLPRPEDMPADYDLHASPDPVADAHETAMVARLSELDEGKLESLAKQHEDDRNSFLAAVKAHIDEHDRQATDERGEGREEAPPARRPGFRADLFGEDTRGAQALADETRRRDTQRSPNRDVSLETGDPTDLFSQARHQVDLEDLTKPAKAKGPEQVSFRTSKGSTYVVDDEGRTTRNKAAQPGKEGEGPQPRSEATYYVSPEDSDKLLEELKTSPHPRSVFPYLDGRIGLRYEAGPKKFKVEHRTVVETKRKPAKGLVPVETWKDGTGIHIGHEIVHVEGPTGQEDFLDSLEAARRETHTAPTDAQKSAGNYKKGRVDFAGMEVAIENPKGSTRKGVRADGEHWSRKMAHDYGYIGGTKGHDGDHVDAFLTGKPDTGKVFVVNQVNPETGKFDEHKAVLGAEDADEARQVYEANYPKGWKGEESIAELTTGQFRKWVESKGPSRGPIRPPSKLDRRTQDARRKAVTQMTPEELRREILTHELTGIPNRRAYREAEKLPHQVSIDVDSLKWVNDNMGHESGDELLKAVASSLSSHSDNVFHLSGDEFAAQAHTETEAHELMRNVAEHMKEASIEVEMPDGRLVKLKGLGVSYGVGKTLEEADAALSAHKARRQAEGARSGRGEAPPGATVRAREEGRENPSSGPAESVEIKENAANYRTLHPAAGRPGVGAAGGGARNLDLFTPEGKPSAEAIARKPPVPQRAVSTRLQQTGEFSSGVTRVESWRDAAHILAPLRKEPQESFLALVADKDRRPLAVLRHTIGTQSASYVVPHTVVGAISRIQGAAHVWFAHNHPSGSLNQSGPDMQITDKLERLMRGSGIETHGGIVVAPGETHASHYSMGDTYDETESLRAAARGKLRVPVQERRFAKIQPLTDMRVITGPEDTRQEIERSGLRSGMLLMNHKLRVIDVLPLEESEMARLRTHDPSKGMARILGELEAHNVSQAIPFGNNAEAVKNLGRMLSAAEIRVPNHLLYSPHTQRFESKGDIEQGTFASVRAAGAAPGGMPRQNVESVVSRIVREVGPGFPHVQVHQDASTLPAHLVEHFEHAGPVQGIYDPRDQNIHLVADHLGTEQEAREVLWHEAVGHHGLRLTMDPASYTAIMDGIARDQPEATLAAARRNGLNMEDPTQRRAAAEELVAYAAGQYLSGVRIDKPVLPWFQRAMRAVKAFFSRMTGKPFYDDRAIAGLIEQARRALAHGTPGVLLGETRLSARAPTFYSAVERAVETSKQGKASGEQWNAAIKSIQGVKPDEIEWLGLEDWLKGQKSVSRQDLLDYIRANRLELVESDLGAVAPPKDQSEAYVRFDESDRERTRLAEELRALGHGVHFNDDGTVNSFWFKPESGIPTVYFPEDEHSFEGLPETIRQKVNHLIDVSNVASAAHEAIDFSEEVDPGRQQYEDYTLHGGKDYHELLLRLPDSPYKTSQLPHRKAIFDEYAPRLRALADELAANRHIWTQDQMRENIKEYDRLSMERDAKADQIAPARRSYISGHWKEPDILAHVRFKSRTDSQGRKVLHLEEIQSDWHQAGRERGYDSPETAEKIRLHEEAAAKLREVAAQARAAMPRSDNFGFDTAGEALEAIRRHSDWEERWDPEPRDTQLFRDYHEAFQELARTKVAANLVPDAPFKTSWPMLAMKRMIRWAAERGFDRLSWTTGKQQNERYSLSETLDHAQWGTNKDGGRSISLELGAYGHYNFTTEPDGTIRSVLERQGRLEAYDIKGKHLSELVGKGLADKILGEESGELSKHQLADIEIGGGGMRGFYDDILPRETGKLIKKYSGQVTDEPVHTEEKTKGAWDGPELSHDAVYDKSRDLSLPVAVVSQLQDTAQQMRNGASFQEAAARNLSSAAAEALGGRMRFSKEMQEAPAHGFDITAQMRQAALGEGFPMFARRQQSLPLQQPGPTGIYEAIRRAVNAIHESKGMRDIRKLVNPVGMSPESKQTASIARAALGNLAHETVKTQEALEQFSRQIDRLPIQDQLEMMDAIERGDVQPHPELQPVADEMRRTLDTWRDKVRGLGDGYLDNFIENYFPHYWREPSEAQRMVASIMGRRPLRGPASFLKMRTIPSIKEGMDAGLTPLTTNPLIMTLLKTREMQRFVTGVTLMRRFKEDGLARFLAAGKPMPEGWGPINDNIAKVRQWSDHEGGFIDRGQYIMPLEAARVINNHVSASAMRDFAPAQIFRRGANALNALQLGFSAFHLGFTTLDAMISKNAQGIERLLHGDVAGAARSFGEGVTPVGAVRNVRRGHKLLQAYTNPAGATPEMQKLVNMLELAGGRAHMDRYYLATEGFSPFRGVGVRSLASDIHQALTAPQNKLERLGEAVKQFPVEYANKLWRGMQEIWKTTPALEVPLEVTGRIVRASTSWIMEHLVPMQKLGVFSDLASDHLKRNPIEDPNAQAAAMQRIWDSVDNRLGEMVYDNVFWNRTLKDTLHLAIRAVGWNLGTIREIAGAPVDLVKAIDQKIRTGEVKASDLGHRIPYVIAMTATTALYASIYQYLSTGRGPQELKDYFFPRTGGVTNYGTPERVSLPSYVKDVYEYAHHPGQTVVNKLNPIFSLLGNLYSNQDFFGSPITDPEADYWHQKLQQLQFVGQAAKPFSFQGRQQLKATQGQTGPGATIQRALVGVGVTPAPGYITSPEQIERRQRLEADKKYTGELRYQLKAAATAHDQKKVKELKEEYVQALKRMKQTEVEVGKDRAKAAIARRKAATSMRQSGFPATANLLASLPIEPDEAARAYFAKVSEAA